PADRGGATVAAHRQHDLVVVGRLVADQPASLRGERASGGRRGRAAGSGGVAALRPLPPGALGPPYPPRPPSPRAPPPPHPPLPCAHRASEQPGGGALGLGALGLGCFGLPDLLELLGVACGRGLGDGAVASRLGGGLGAVLAGGGRRRGGGGGGGARLVTLLV